MHPDYPALIQAARVYDVALKSPLEQAANLSRRLGREVWLKREDLQPVHSFKLRGAYNKIAGLGEERLAAGVITASAGNHAQGVALAAARRGVRARIVMPKTTPGIKVDAVRRLGGEVLLHGNTYDEAYEHARQLAAEGGAVLVHPYDDPEVIAGQGTVGVEILEQCPEPEAIFVPVGGGGLIAGVAAWVKARRPATRIIGVEPDDAPTLHAALAAGERVVLPQVGLFADGVAVRQIGEETFRVARNRVDEVILVSTDAICAAIRDIYEDTRGITEPAGALAVAGLKVYAARAPGAGGPLVAINSGANMNFDRLRYVAERAAVGELREALLAVTIPEQPGSFRAFCHALGPRSITEFNYRYANGAQAQVFAGVELREGAAERERLIAHLCAHGYAVRDLSGDEMAKLHVRHMVGGHAPAAHERIFRFQFPERPGALLHFLTRMSGGWNISLFHYRNHGADYGRVLAGIQVPPQDEAAFGAFISALGYPCIEETANPAYQLFLGGG
jgi:threonine dehydratase